MKTEVAVTCLAWLGLVQLVLVASQYPTPLGLTPSPTPALKPGQPPAFVITPLSPIREVFCSRKGPMLFNFGENRPGSGKLTVKVMCPQRGFLSVRLPAPQDFRAELSAGPSHTNPFGFVDSHTKMSKFHQDHMVSVHNFQRSTVNPAAEKMYQLSFSPDMAGRADSWVTRCSEGLENSGVGENVAKMPGRIPVDKAMDLAFENWMKNPITKRQVLADEAKMVGCAFNDKCRDISGEYTLVACYFDKQDQLPGEPYPYKLGPSCSQCSQCLNRLCAA